MNTCRLALVEVSAVCHVLGGSSDRFHEDLLIGFGNLTFEQTDEYIKWKQYCGVDKRAKKWWFWRV
jgi:hypothetical protein